MPDINYGPAFDVAQQWMHELNNKQSDKKGRTGMAQKFQLDDTAYFRDNTDKEICYGNIVSMSRNRHTGDILLVIEDVKNISEPKSSKKYKYNQVTINANNCYETIDELSAAIATEEKAALDIYRWQINSIEDLIKFALNNDVSGESFRIEIDEPETADKIRYKRIVFIEKAQELLGLSNLPVEFPEDCCI